MPTKTTQDAAEAVIQKLTGAGFEAFLAGGCVRDLLLGLEPEDYDVATSAQPEQICTIYPRAELVGAHFGVVLVRQFGCMIEVATFRSDGPYLDGRHPEQIIFATARQDAQRRDFTINGMFYDVLKREVIDYVGGQQDLKDKIVQAIGNPEKRFEEDHLRMLRAVRFAARLGFHLEQETFEAIYNRADKISRVSAERIREELEKILCVSRRAEGFDLLCATGLLPHLWPESAWSTVRIRQSRAALASLPPSSGFVPALSALLFHHSPADVGSIARALACSNALRKEMVWLAQSLERLRAGPVETPADLKLLMAGPCFDDLLSCYRAVLMAEEKRLDGFEALRARADAIAPQDVRPAPLLRGDDLSGLGLVPGPIFKKILKDVYYRQLNGEVTDRREALESARQIIRSHSDS